MTGRAAALLATLALAFSLAAPAAAQDIAFRRWGVRAGLGDSPDQLIVGAQADMGEFIRDLRFEPNFEVGVGDDTTVVSVTAPVHYRFHLQTGFGAYAGGGIELAVVDRSGNDRQGGGSDFEISPVAVGGLEWTAGRNGDLFAELTAGGGDVHDLKIMLGWMF